MDSPLGKLAAGLLLAFVASALLALVLALPTMLLWNWIVPAVFGWSSIGFFQAWGLLMLIKLLKEGADVKITLKE